MRKRKTRITSKIIYCVTALLISPSILVYSSEVETNQETQAEESEEEPDYILGRKMTEEEEKEALDLTDYYNSMTTVLIEEEPVKSVSMDNELYLAGLLPDAYDSRDAQVITDIKDQNPYGTCWAFTAVNSLEASAVKSGILDKENADLSELHLVYYTMFPVVDELGGTSGDKTEYIPGGSGYLQVGANVQVAYYRLANWQGAVDEETASYERAGDDLPATVDSAYKQDIIHLQNVFVYSSAHDMESIKQAIIDYGAAGISFNSSSSYYNANTAAYYCPVKTGTNHAVSIVGWDDNYKKENFAVMPENDGAWLVKNSWGESWGDQGYFWLSYEDQSIGSNAYILQAEPANNYEHNYQYDGTVFDDVYSIQSDTLKIANVFEAAANQGGQEEIAAVSFATTMVNTSFRIQIYIDPEEKSNPESGQPALEEDITGVIGASGYYTVPLRNKVILEEGQCFSVVITLENDAGNMEFVCDGDRTVQGVIKSTAHADEGQSFVELNGVWQDFGEMYNRNLRIKAFTNDIYGWQPTENPSEEPTAAASPVPTLPSGTEPTKTPDVVPSATPVPSEEEDFPFEDVAVIPGNWKYEGIKYVYQNNIMKGITNPDGTINTFQPDAPLTRAMFATVLYRMAGTPPVVFEQHFSDVSSGRYYSDAIVWAYQNKIVNGYADGSYGIDDYITREQIAKMLKEYADLKGYDTSERAEISSFPDASEVSGWAADYMRWAVGCKMINGKNQDGIYYLDAKGNATRAECATMLKRFLNKYED